MSVRIEASTSERLKEAMKLKDMKQADLVRATGIDKASISLYVQGKYSPKGDKLYKLALALDVSPTWLSGFNVPMKDSNLYSINNDIYTLPSPGISTDNITFPIIGEVAAGFDKIAIEDWCGDKIDIPPGYIKGAPDNYFVLRITGNSMYPMYIDGDVVLVRKQNDIDYDGQVTVLIYGDDCGTIKKLERRNNSVRLVPINPQYEPEVISGTDIDKIRILGVPKVLIRDLEE